MRFSKLILATNNRHKIAELTALLDGAGVTILTKADFSDFPEIEETANTLAENALEKSRTIFRKYGIPAVADDTGLEVDSLGGAPGVYSARYAGEGCTFADNNRKLLQELEGVPVERRRARFVTVIGVTYTGGEVCLEGDVDGYIATEPRGDNGFGYDPVFVYQPLGKTFAEMDSKMKNIVSHRAVALGKFKDWLLS
ncbi:MAG: RdgB/HAM1 family non-canonical purine NTP pyrophosphatase [Candidatus Zixiibacteriota bacterium]|nr:MAG: RdgB/HAM1 family non-canonical purine NTP pyrophosphatase [candidate division Zixibacteria bacterium]